MDNLRVRTPPKRGPETEIIALLEGMLEMAREGRLSSIVAGYLYHGDGVDPDITTVGVGDTIERLALAAMVYRGETDPD